MKRYSETRPQINPVARNFPERLRVVRSASVRPNGVSFSASAFVSDARGCWRPGMKLEDARPVNAAEALRRHAQIAAAKGVYAPERRKAAA